MSSLRPLRERCCLRRIWLDLRLTRLNLEAGACADRGKGKTRGFEFRHPFLDLVVQQCSPITLRSIKAPDRSYAPGHGIEDFQTGQKYGIEAYAPIDGHGRYLEGPPEYKGKTVFEANPIVVNCCAIAARCSANKNFTQLSALLALPTTP